MAGVDARHRAGGRRGTHDSADVSDRHPLGGKCRGDNPGERGCPLRSPGNHAGQADRTALPFQLRPGVLWPDGKPFTAADVKCTWDLILGHGADKLRTNPRKSWYRNLDAISTKDDTVTFHLKRPQPAFIALLASGYSPVYPCHVPAQNMRQHPIGTGPFKFVSYKPNESIKLVRNP